MRISLFAIAITLASLSLRTGTAQGRQTPLIQDRWVGIQAAHQGYPWINLDDGRGLEVRFNTDSDLAVRFREQQAEGSVTPLSLVSVDFDEDGISDIVYGYATSEGGSLILQRGDPDWKGRTILSTGSVETLSNDPFLPEASVIELNRIPRFVEAGDLNADGHLDLVVADLNAGSLTQLIGAGDGHFIAGKDVLLPGGLTTMAAGDVNRRDGLVDILVGIEGITGPALLVFEGPDGALSHPPEVIELPSPAVALDVSQFDSHYSFDIAVAMETEILIVHGRDRKLSQPQSRRLAVPAPEVSRYSFASRILSIVAGDFVSDHDDELALWLEDGSLRLLERTGDDLQLKSDWMPGLGAPFQNLLAGPGTTSHKLVRARVSSLPKDELLAVDALAQKIHVLVTANASGNDSSGTHLADSWSAALAVAGIPVAVLPMRLNRDALSDLVVLSDGYPSLSTIVTQSSKTFTVNSSEDNFTCLQPEDPGGECTLRGAINKANQPASGAGPFAIQFSVDEVTLTRTFGDGGADLEIFKPMNIQGGGNVLVTASDSAFFNQAVFHVFSEAANSSIKGLRIAANANAIIVEGTTMIEGNVIGSRDKNADGQAFSVSTGITLINTSNSSIKENQFPNVSNSAIRIQGVTDGAGNIIAFHLAGIRVEGPHNRILSNSIFSNQSGIVSAGGIGQSAPQNLAAGVQPLSGPTDALGVSWELVGKKTKPPFTVQFFANPECEPSGWGKTLIDTVQVEESPPADGKIRRFTKFPFAIEPGEWITATATSEDGGTSKFSPCLKVELDTDGDGVADESETGDRNDNGFPDSEEPNFTTLSANGNQIDIETAAQTIGAAIFLAALEGDQVLPAGLLDLVLRELGTPGPTVVGLVPLAAATTVTLTLPPDLKVDSYYNFGPTPDNPDPHFYEFLFDGTTGAEILPPLIVLHFVDGQRGDHDLTENGEIVTRGGPTSNATPLYIPFNQTGSGTFTGFAVSNVSGRNAVVQFDAFGQDGELSLFSNNPAVFGISESTQLAQLGSEIFEESSESVSWVKLKTDNPEIGSFFQVGGAGQLDGSVALTEPSKKLYFTRVFEGPTGYRGQPAKTFLSIANPDADPITVQLNLLGPLQQGQSTASFREPSQALAPEQTRVIAGRGFLCGSISDLFGGDLNVSNAFVEVNVTQGEGAVGFEQIQLQNQTDSFSAQLTSLPPGLFTNIKVINVSDETRSLTATAFAEDGSNLADPVQVVLEEGELLEMDARDLFGFEDLAIGSLKMEGDGDGVIGDVIFGDGAAFTYAAALPLQSQTFTQAVFSQVANLEGFFTGLALFNPTLETADVTIEVFSAEGEKTGELELQLGPSKRISELLTELIPSTAGQLRGFHCDSLDRGIGGSGTVWGHRPKPVVRGSADSHSVGETAS